jgi:hypothetical protein
MKKTPDGVFFICALERVTKRHSREGLEDLASNFVTERKQNGDKVY